jgi:hypothetical protein
MDVPILYRSRISNCGLKFKILTIHDARNIFRDTNALNLRLEKDDPLFPPSHKPANYFIHVQIMPGKVLRQLDATSCGKRSKPPQSASCTLVPSPF